MPRLSKEERNKYIEKLHDLLLNENPRMPFRQIGRKLKIYSKTVSKIYKEAVEEKILYPPMLRPKICIDHKEYVYIINGKGIRTLFEKLIEDSRIEYIACCQGCYDMLLIASDRIDLTVEEEFKNIVLSGEKENYIYPEVRRGNYHTVLNEINKFLERGEFQLSQLPFETGKRENEWSEREKRLFRYLKNDGRRKFADIQKRLGISRTLLLQCYSNVKKHTIITAPYYPKGYDSYISLFLVMQTRYEQQAVNLLGRLPCYSVFFKVRNFIIWYTGVEKDFMYDFMRLTSKILSTRFAESLIYSIPLYYYTRD